MKADRLQRVEAGLTAISRKVLSVVPINEGWSSKAIGAEMYRLTRARIDYNVLEGCLDTLVDSGVVKEHPRGTFQRVTATPHEHASAPHPEPLSPKVAVMPSPPVAYLNAKPADDTYLDKLARAAADLRAAATSLGGLATLIEDAALDARQCVEDESAKANRFDQLRILLKGMD